MNRFFENGTWSWWTLECQRITYKQKVHVGHRYAAIVSAGWRPRW